MTARNGAPEWAPSEPRSPQVFCFSRNSLEFESLGGGWRKGVVGTVANQSRQEQLIPVGGGGLVSCLGKSQPESCSLP